MFDQFKCLVFVTGLKASKHADIRTRLLTRMENERPDAPVTLQTLIDEFQQLVNLKADTSLIEHPASSKAAVHAISEKKRLSEVPKPSFKPEAKSPKTPCWQCGQMHFVKECTYSNHLCKSCNRVGHKEGYCGCFTKTSNAPAGDNSNQKGKKNQKKTTKYQANIVHTVNHTGNLTRFVTTMMNGRQATLQLDSGSPITIISEETWRKVGSPALKPSFCEALSATKDPLPLLGEFTCLVGVNDVIKPGLCRVTSVKGLNLFGSEWMDLFEMWTKPLSSFINQVNQSNSNSFSGKHFLMRFPEVFQDTLGHCQKAQISLHLKPDAKPIFRPKRPVPYNAIPLVETELNRLQQLGIISPVDYSDWAAPIVAVQKPGGKVRICADYSTGLNSMLEAHNFPLPTPDDIFSKLAGSKAFSIIDLSDAYLQVEVDDASKRLLTINTHRGLFNFNRLAPGVKSAPGAFQQLMHTMIAGISGVEVFLDDFIIFSKNEEQHYQTLCTLFSCLQEYRFHLKLDTIWYDFDIVFVSTNNFGYADVLSRLISSHERPEEEFVVASVNIEPDQQCILDSTIEHQPVTSIWCRKLRQQTQCCSDSSSTSTSAGPRTENRFRM
ncbi:uncharacterized protein K02A2.6-like [Toxorhynchites rutilus septentrionalis]|uniref:uncharacterized protein K02A2.6-like n=1 Tax=Toxorhynchites rutilus septentrionalis TaxID=329112 RepID=UPI00247916C7|nr:uncharacterized protein K02A2.6-like [Toxorhynchites rutilus septentrionalis]